VWNTNTGAPVSSTDRDNVKLSVCLCTLDRVGNFLRALGAETKVAIAITKGNECLESKTVTSLGLLLHRVDLQAFFLETSLGVTVWCAKEVVNDFLFLDWECVEVNVFQVLDLARLDETSELGAWGPDFLVSVSTTSTSASATSATSAATVTTATSATTVSTTAASISKASAETQFTKPPAQEFTDFLSRDSK